MANLLQISTMILIFHNYYFYSLKSKFDEGTLKFFAKKLPNYIYSRIATTASAAFMPLEQTTIGCFFKHFGHF